MRTNDSCFLALDTSCYTTSLAVVCGSEVVYDNRIMLEVPQGTRGLRQSEAVFQHVKNAKQLFLDFSQMDYDIQAVGYSKKPCLREDSYMPVFTVGETLAHSCAASLGVPVYASTHQHGHIYAAFFGNDMDDGVYCVFHVSGGTLELLHVEINGEITKITSIGGTKDITCGQLIDRVGVSAGLPFPSGKAMEARYCAGGAKLAVNVQGLETNLSGAETQAVRLLDQGEDVDKVCSGTIDCVANTLCELTANAAREGYLRFVFTGGVICNTMIRGALKNQFEILGVRAVFTQIKYCSDNACGVALAAKIKYSKEKEFE